LLTAAADAAITTSGIEQITDTTLAMADYRLFRFEGVAPGASRPV